MRITHQQIGNVDNVGTESRPDTTCTWYFLQIKLIYAPVHHSCTTYIFHRRLSFLVSTKDVYGLSKYSSKTHKCTSNKRNQQTIYFKNTDRTTDNYNILLASPFAFDFMSPDMMSLIYSFIHCHFYLFSAIRSSNLCELKLSKWSLESIVGYLVKELLNSDNLKCPL